MKQSFERKDSAGFHTYFLILNVLMVYSDVSVFLTAVTRTGPYLADVQCAVGQNVGKFLLLLCASCRTMVTAMWSSNTSLQKSFIEDLTGHCPSMN